MALETPEGFARSIAEKNIRLESQIDKLAKVLLEEFGGPTENESAAEMAIRLLREPNACKEAAEKAAREDKEKR